MFLNIERLYSIVIAEDLPSGFYEVIDGRTGRSTSFNTDSVSTMYSILQSVVQYADIGLETATNRARFGVGPAPGRHPVLGGGIGGPEAIRGRTGTLTLAVWLRYSLAPPT